MYISTNDWKNYINKLSQLNKEAADKIVAYVQKKGFADTDALIEFSNAVVQKYGSGSAALSAAMYDAIAEVSGQFYDPAELAPLPNYGEIAKTVRGTLKRSQNPNTLAGAVSRLVKKAGIDTTLQNAARDSDGPAYDGTEGRRTSKRAKARRHTGAQVAWVPYGDTCPFCLMLASRGWMNQTYDGADNHKEHIHSNCDCTYAVRFDNHSGIEGYDPNEYYDMFKEYEGTWQDKLNAMRRAQYEENKDKINAQKREAYRLRNKKDDDVDLSVFSLKKESNNKELLRIEAESPFKHPATPLKIDSYDQSKHIEGGEKYNEYVENHEYPPSILTISEEKAQELVDKYHGTGILKLDRHKEIIPVEMIVDNDEIIGYAVNNKNGARVATTGFKIHYSNKGTHIVPMYENQKQ